MPVEIIQQMQENSGGPIIHSDSITPIEKSPDLDILKERYIHHTEEFLLLGTALVVVRGDPGVEPRRSPYVYALGISKRTTSFGDLLALEQEHRSGLLATAQESLT